MALLTGRNKLLLFYNNVTTPRPSLIPISFVHKNNPPLPSSIYHLYFCTSNSSNKDEDDHLPPHPIPNRPLRGERLSSSARNAHHLKPSSPPPPPRTQHHFYNNNTPTTPSPTPTPNPTPTPTPMRDDEFDSHIFTKTATTIRPHPNTTTTIPQQENPSQVSFLERFKLGNDDTAKSTNSPTTHVPQTETTPPSPPEDADEIFKKMKETGLIPNAVAMLDGLCKDGLVQEAMKLFGLMREKGTIPEVVIYTAVVEGFCKALKLDDAKRIFRKMQTNGISPNAFTYTIFIQGLCKAKRLDDALHFCLEMLEAGHSPNAPTFTTLIDSFCREKGVEEAQEIIRRLTEKGFFLNDKAVREYLEKKGPFSSLAWEAIFGKKNQQRMF